MPLPTRTIGDSEVSAIGYGAMGIAIAYGTVPPDEKRLQLLDEVYKRGCTFWDTADVYGDSEELIGKWLKRTGKRKDIFLATKFGSVAEPDRAANGSPEYARQSLNRSLARLGVDCIDLYYLHRPDPTVPIEVTIGAMADFVREGKVKYLGISECSADTLRRAHAVHPIAALEVEYSPFTLDIEDPQVGLLATARELGIAVVAYAPLGRGLITGRYKNLDDLEPDDFRKMIPRYSRENFPNILKIAEGLKVIGERHNATAAQVSLAWLLAQGKDIIPIPGTMQFKYAEENLAAINVQLSPAELQEVREIAKRADAAHGDRYPKGLIALIFGDTPSM